MGIDFENNIDLGIFRAAADAAFPIAMARGGEVVRAKAVERTPDATGNLAGSAGVTVIGAGAASEALIKYPGPYAAFQNRGMRADGTHVIKRRPAGGQTGFLTETMNDQKDAVLDIIADTVAQLT